MLDIDILSIFSVFDDRIENIVPYLRIWMTQFLDVWTSIPCFSNRLWDSRAINQSRFSSGWVPVRRYLCRHRDSVRQYPEYLCIWSS